jgi:PTS system mannose-specific IIA component
MKIKGLIITHGNLGHELVAVAEKILRENSDIDCVALDWEEDGSAIFTKIEKYLKHITDRGVLVFTDMFGGSPANVCFKFHSQNIEIITGINLPGLLKFITYQHKIDDLQELAQTVKKASIEGVSIISEYLGETKK